MNRVIYDDTRTFGGVAHFWIWPTVDTGDNKISPLYDARVTEVLLQQDMEHCCVTPWSIGQEGEKEHRLKNPKGIATNSSGEFMYMNEDFVIHTFGEHGDHLNKFEPQLNDFVYTSITFHPASEHVVVAGRGLERHVQVKIYSKDGKFVRSVQIQNCDEFFDVRGITVNNDGHIAVVTRNVFYGKVIVL